MFQFQLESISSTWSLFQWLFYCAVSRLAIIVIIIMALQPFVETWPLFQFLDPIRSL
jgi:hypothetical protein